MKKITIERPKKFAGSAIKYHVVLNLKGSDFKEKIKKGAKKTFLDESDQVFSLPNGKTVVIETSEEKNSFFIMAFTSGGKLFSERIFVEEQDGDAKYMVKLKMGMTSNQFLIEKV